MACCAWYFGFQANGKAVDTLLDPVNARSFEVNGFL